MLKKLSAWLGRALHRQPIAKIDIARAYTKHPTITDYLPWCDYNEKHKLFLLEDNQTLAMAFHITPIACEARPSEMLAALSRSLKQALQNAIPCEKENPWILQVYVERTRDLSQYNGLIGSAVSPELKDSKLTQAHLKTLKKHLEFVSREEGIFFDKLVTNQIFRGGLTSVHVFLYRRASTQYKADQRRDVLQEILRTSRKLSDQLRACGLKIQRMNEVDFITWMRAWFNPSFADKSNPRSQLLTTATPTEIKKSSRWDLAEQLFFKSPESFSEGWLFDNQPHKVLTIQSLNSEPQVGHLTAERSRGTDDKLFTLLDNLPDGSRFVVNVAFQAQSEVEQHLKIIHNSAVGRHAQALKVKTEIEIAETAMVNGDVLLPVTMAVYINGKTLDDLHEKEAQVEVLLNNNGFKLITDDEVFSVDSYLRYLPMCYNYHLDKKYYYRSRYILLSDIAKLLPFYGRSRGTENPGMLFFNRGGEPWLYDIFKDRTKNAHLLVLGDTGTGKSNFLNFLTMHMLALYKPRFFIIEAGGSFDLLGDYCQELGLSVNKVKINPKHPVSLNPFANGLKVLEQLEQLEVAQQRRFLNNTEKSLAQERKQNYHEDNPDEGVDSLDPLGDMVLAALVMITGGEQREEDKITRADRMLIMDAIILAAKTVKANQAQQMIASDLITALEALTNQLDATRDIDKIKRAREMCDSLRYFTRDIVSSQFFNTPGEPWGLADVTIVDLGLFAHEGYEAQRSLAFTGCMQKVLALAEANQYSNRPLILLSDEDHITSKIALLAAIKTRLIKMGRKLGLWLWLATQNVKDFHDEASKMLSLIETWICLNVSEDEINHIQRFKSLTLELKSLLRSARKEPGKYTEGVLISLKIAGIFRSIPPRPYLTLAQTEQFEKNQRKIIMQQKNCSEIEAAFWIANEMLKKSLVATIHD